MTEMLSAPGFIQYLKARRELGLVKRSELLKAGEFSRNTEIRVHCVFVSVDGYYCLLRFFGIDCVVCSTTILIGVFVWFVTALKGSF